MLKISNELMSRLHDELGFSERYVLKIYSGWLDKDYLVDRHFVMEEPFEAELCEMLKVSFKLIDLREGIKR